MFLAHSRELRNDGLQTINLKPSEGSDLLVVTTLMVCGETGESSDMQPKEPETPLPLRSVLTKPVVVTIANHAMFALINLVAATYIPLVWSTPVEFGGLDMSPASIGLRLSVYGGMNGVFQFALARGISSFPPSLHAPRSTSSSLSKTWSYVLTTQVRSYFGW